MRSGPLRIGFVTDEFVTDSPDAGGLAGYLDRTTRALADLGHEVEVFTRSFRGARVESRGGVRVESVPPQGMELRGIRRRLALAGWSVVPRDTRGRLRTAWSLGRAFAQRDAERPFDLVQSTDCSAAGLFVPRRPGLRHVLRLSSCAALWRAAEDHPARLDDVLVERLERRCLRRADRVYAPSRYLAGLAGALHGVPVDVLRPPFALLEKPAAAPPAALPPRYLVHFGTLMRRKGCEWLAASLPRVWEREPDFRMVWAGREWPAGTFARCRAAWGGHADRVRYLGSLVRPDLYAVVQGAVASVAPALADNLPNGVMESLALGVPVIGTRGASIDEIVEDGASGALVPPGDVDALADALVAAWRGEWLGGGFRAPALLDSLRPEAAAGALLELAFGETAP